MQWTCSECPNVGETATKGRPPETCSPTCRRAREARFQRERRAVRRAARRRARAVAELFAGSTELQARQLAEINALIDEYAAAKTAM